MIAPRRLPLPLRILLLAAALPLVSLAAQAQSAPDARSPLAVTASDNKASDFTDISPADLSKTEMLRTMARERNELRQKTIVDDTARLLSLAQQLKAAVDKSSKDQLSLQVVDTASEIEKLAKTVKDRMRDGN